MYESLKWKRKGYKCKRQDLGEYVTNIIRKREDVHVHTYRTAYTQSLCI